MKLLVLGGGVFLGAAVLRAALARGHAVTVFNRGQSRREWPAGVEALIGDRTRDLGLLGGRRFDAVVDTCGYVAADVQASAAALRHATSRYCFVSSISAYASFAHAPVVEDDPLAAFAGIDRTTRDAAQYGAQKAACEAEVTAAFGERAFIVRPGLIVGPGDPTGRFSHWPWRAMEGGEILIPAAPDGTPLQFIDVRDVGEWMVRALEADASGAFNATGPVGRAAISWPELVASCRNEAARNEAPPARVVAIDEAFLLAQGVAPWSELPLWLPASDTQYFGHSRVAVERAAQAGLTTRTLSQTLAAILDEGVPATHDPQRTGKLTREREAAVIARWREHVATAAADATT